MHDVSRREAFALGGGLAFATAAPAGAAAQPAPGASAIEVHADRPAGSLTRFWRSTGFTPAELLLLPEMRQTLTFLGAVPNRGVEFVRVHYLLNLVAGVRGPGGIAYEWSLLDEALDALVSRGLRPVFELMGNPSDLFDDFESSDQLHAWRDMVAELAVRYAARYGPSELREWTFETWNEPDLPFWRWGTRGLLNHFDACRAGLDAVDPSLRLGGPATAQTLSPMFKAFLAHCDGGVSALTGQPAGRLDFISVHEKGAPAHEADLNPRPLEMIGRELQAIAYVRANHPRLAGLPFHNDEADPQLGWQTSHTWRALPYYAALIARIADQHQRLLADRDGVAPSITNDHGFLGGWGQRTLFTHFGARAFPHAQADHRTDLAAVRDQRAAPPEPFEIVKKPALAAMEFLALLGPERCAVVAEPALDPDRDGPGIVATRAADDRLAILVYSSVDRIWTSGERRVSLALRGLPPGEYAVAAFRIDDARNPFHLWDGLGAPARPSADAFALMRAAGEAALLIPPERKAVGADGLALDLLIPLPSLTLLLVEREEGEAPPAPQRVTAEMQPGLTEQTSVLLSWTGGAHDGVQLYDVLFAASAACPFEPVTPQPLLSSAFLHARPPGPGYYAVRSRNLSGSRGARSTPLPSPE